MAIVNLKNYDFTQIKVSFLGNTYVVGVKSIEYSMKQDKTLVYGAGALPVGIGKGVIDYSGKLGIHLSEVNKMKVAAGVKQAVDIPPFDLVIQYADGTAPLETVTLAGCQFTEESVSVASGDTETVVDMPIVFLSIL